MHTQPSTLALRQARDRVARPDATAHLAANDRAAQLRLDWQTLTNARFRPRVQYIHVTSGGDAA